MLIGYSRVSKTDGSQALDLQNDAIIKKGVDEANIYSDRASGKKEARLGLENCLKALRKGDVLIVWKLDRLGRSLKHLVDIVQELNDRGIGLKILSGKGANIDTSTPTGRLFFGIFAVLAEFEHDLIVERTRAGLLAARARGRIGGRKSTMTKAKIKLIQAAMSKRETQVGELAKSIGVTRATIYNYVGPNGQLRERAKKILNAGKNN